jgi:hypothetical protein
MKRMYPLGLMILCLQLLLGCGGDGTHDVTGRVTFEDGSPLTKGEVVFEGEEFEAIGRIKEDGTYELSSYGDGDGAPPGTYKVYLGGGAAGNSDDDSGDTDDEDDEGESEDRPEDEGDGRGTVHRPLVHPDFLSAETSRLECKVDGDTEFDIKVRKP